MIRFTRRTALLATIVGLAVVSLSVWSGRALVTASPAPAAGDYEVWLIDQADAAHGGEKLYIYQGTQFGPAGVLGRPEVVDLNARARGIGDGPGVRPHLITFNSTQSHAAIANVASGHVYILRTADRRLVASIKVGVQAHAAVISPDDRLILVANQNGKRLARIEADFTQERFRYQPEADLDLAALESAFYPDNAPICPLLFANATNSYVTLRGGGLMVVDPTTTPISLRWSLGRDVIAPAGCGGVRHNERVYVNSGTANSSDVYVFDIASGNRIDSLNLRQWGRDSHGLALLGGRYLWTTQRAGGENVTVVDITTHSVLGTIAIGPAPDLIEASPAQDLVFATLRGPDNLTGGPGARGITPGFVVIRPSFGGGSGQLQYFVPIGEQGAGSRSDPHAIAVRTR